ncbi:MAG: 4Fe-4S dicluster domain-containing protein [Trueperaceae bacterium]|nr:4Fe-4S dicluster domain-containing protein [Trueperaceae bacterium]
MQGYRLEPSGLEQVFEKLKSQSYEIIGPKLKDDAIVYDRLTRVKDLPIGLTDEQGPGYYRLKKRNDDAYFGYVLGPQSVKHYLHPPVFSLWQAKRTEDGFAIPKERESAPRYAFIGVRACELNAILIQDKVFLDSDYQDPVYLERRKNAFILAVNCTQAAPTCFCSSLGTGPKVEAGFDLLLTELINETEHYFVLETGSEKGQVFVKDVNLPAASEAELEAAQNRVKATEEQISKKLPTEGIKDLLYASYEHPHWDEIAERCLSCGNCTMVCPTCFCTTVDDVTSLTGDTAERVRRWDSCFTSDFSYIHGGSVRPSSKSRYRQWMTHKLASWQDQFGSLGCVGCGRCISWCPVGIDITAELEVFRQERGQSESN